MMEVITNNAERLLLDFDQIPEKIRESEFDYLNDEEVYGRDFVKYKERYYDLGEFQRIEETSELSTRYGFEGIEMDSFFSGVLVKYTDSDHVIMGTVLT